VRIGEFNMSKMSFSFTLSVILLLSAIPLASVAAQTSSVHNLDTGLDYTTIQAAIDAPETLNGHTIYVDAGTYYENISVTKSISLIGENSGNTIIDGGGGTATVVNVTNVNNVEISGFTLQNGGSGSGGSGGHGIYMYSCSNNTISGNNITNNFIGISMYFCSNNTISGNTITNNITGVTLTYSPNNRLINNTLSNHRNLNVSGGQSISDYIQDIDSSNTVEGKPVFYWINQHNITVPSDAGYVTLINCTYITVENQYLTKNGEGILLVYTKNSLVINNNFTYNSEGVRLSYSHNNTFSGNNITHNNWGGVGFSNSFNNTFFGNNIIHHFTVGVSLYESYNNTVTGNSIISNGRGFYLDGSNFDTLSGNRITANSYGIMLSDSAGTIIYNNNFIDNSVQTSVESSNCLWDDGFPLGGNYWSDYNGTDADGDSIGDTPYVIDENNQDNCPLMEPFGTKEHVFNVTVGEVTVPVVIVTNSSISEFVFSETSQQVSFNVTGPTGTSGVCNISIPEDLLWGDFSVYLNGALLVEDADYTQTYNGTHNIFYITYSHSSHMIEITGTEVIPELSSLVLLSTFIITTVVVIIYGKNRREKGKFNLFPKLCTRAS
jgi:parallel beta-helix repeat protein